MFHNIVKHFTMTGQYDKMFHNVSQYCIISLSGQKTKKKPHREDPGGSGREEMDKKGTHPIAVSL
jgi:hypothetical protein